LTATKRLWSDYFQNAENSEIRAIGSEQATDAVAMQGSG
jgi:hypothetical protein